MTPASLVDRQPRRKKLKVESIEVEVPPAILHFPSGRPQEELPGKASVYANPLDGYAVLREEALCEVAHLGTVKQRDDRKPCRYALGVFHKRKRSLKLLPVMGDRVVRMEPRVKGLQYAPSDMRTIDTSDIAGDEVPNRFEGSKEALATFGGATTKKKLKWVELQKPEEQSAEHDSALQSLMQSVSAKAKEQGLTKAQVMEKCSKERVLPPHHGEGRTLETAFVFDELCPVSHQKDLYVERFMKAVHSKDEEMQLRKTGASNFVVSHLGRLKGLPEEEAQNTVTKLSFLNALLHMIRNIPDIRRIDQRSVKAEAVARNLGFHPSLFQFLLSLFWEERGNVKRVSRYDLPEAKLMLLHFYILVVALIVKDADMSSDLIEQLRVEMKVSKKTMLQRFQSLGAKIVERASPGAFGVLMLKDGRTLNRSLPSVAGRPRLMRF